jgi:Mo-dependent nitrogenase C-terminus
MNSTISILAKHLCPDLSFRDRLVQPVRHWIDSIAVGDRQIARLLCQLIPAQCPFE